jgi:hypothetical protein
LQAWLKNAGVDNPVRAYLQVDCMHDYLDAVEDTLQELDCAAPRRLEGKRRDFRGLRAADRWFDLYSELYVAAWLARKRVAFEFGEPGKPQPDLVLPDRGFGIEVTRRERRAREDLVAVVCDAIRTVEDRLPPRTKPLIRLNGQPVAIRQKVLRQLSNRVVGALLAGERTVRQEVRSAIDGHDAIEVDVDFYAGWSRWPRFIYTDEAAKLAVPMLDIEDLVARCLEDKRKARQGAGMPSLLMIDVTHLSDVVWLRPLERWSRELGRVLSPEHTFVAVGLLLVGPGEGPRIAIGIAPWAESSVKDAILTWAGAVGLVVTTQ